MNRSNWKLLGLFITLFSLIAFGIISSKNDKRLLSDCSKVTSAVVIDKYRIRSRGHFIRYSFIVNDKEYNRSKSLKKKDEVEFFNIGDTIEIRYSCKTPKVSTPVFTSKWE